MTAFKAYDIRGVYGKDFTKEDVYRIGFFLPKIVKTDKILIGKIEFVDRRRSRKKSVLYMIVSVFV